MLSGRIAYILGTLSLILLYACSSASQDAGSNPPAASNVAVSYGTPAGGSLVKQNVSISWTELDPAPTRVRVLLSNNSGQSYDTELATVNASTSFLWDSTSVPDGNYRVRLLPMDENDLAGNPVDSGSNFVVDNTPPQVQNISPSNGQSISGNAARVSWQTTDDNPSTVTIRLSSNSGGNFDTILVEDIQDSQFYSFNTISYNDGNTYQLSIVATDAAGNFSQNTTTTDFSINNSAPVASPRVTGIAHFFDINSNSQVDQGDKLSIFFDHDIAINSPVAADLKLSATGDSLGTNPGFAIGRSNELVITLGAGASLTIKGTGSASSTQPGSPSGIDIASQISTGSITSSNSVNTAVPSEIVDIFPMFVEAQLLPGCPTTGVSLGHFNNDTFLDLSHSCDNTFGRTDIYTNDGNGNFTVAVTLPANITNGGRLVDLNRDGFADYVDINRFEGINGDMTSLVYINNQNGGFNTPQSLGVDSHTAYGLAIADVNNDQQPDIIIGRYNLPSTIFINNNGVFEQLPAQIPAQRLTNIYAQKINDDTNIDIIVGGHNGDPHKVYHGDGSGNFQFAYDLPYTPSFGRFAFAHLNNDQRIDMVAGSSAANSANVVFYNVAGRLESSNISFGNSPSYGLSLFDIDLDGDADLFEATEIGVPAYVWINSADTFVDSGARLASRQTRAELAVGDIDNDGDMDVIVGNAYNETAVWKSSGATP